MPPPACKSNGESGALASSRRRRDDDAVVWQRRAARFDLCTASAVDAAFLAKAVLVAGATLPGASALVAATNAREMRMFNCIAAITRAQKSRSQWVTQDCYGTGSQNPASQSLIRGPCILIRGPHTQMRPSGCAKRAPRQSAARRPSSKQSKGHLRRTGGGGQTKTESQKHPAS